MAKKNSRYGKHSFGYPITNKLTDRYGRKTVVVKRQNGYVDDYAVGLGYDERCGQWAQGVYGFKTREQALNYAKYVSYKKRGY